MHAAPLHIDDKAEITQVVPAEANLLKAATGFKFVEGPVWTPRPFAPATQPAPGNVGAGSLYFSDIPANTIFHLIGDKQTAVFRKPTNETNGNTLDRSGRLLSCEGAGRRVSRTEEDGKISILADTYNGKKLNSPNDVIVRSDGLIYFTDPTYGLAGGIKEQDGNYVYRINPDSRAISKVADGFDQPNGLCFSPDEKRMYIADSGKPHHVKVFEVNADGTLGEPEIFCEIDNGVPDGMRCDTEGRLYCTAGDGVHVFLPSGKRIGKILVPEVTANCCFGGIENRTLFMTATTSVYSIELKARGAK